MSEMYKKRYVWSEENCIFSGEIRHFMEILVENDRITVSVGCKMVCAGGVCKGIEC